MSSNPVESDAPSTPSAARRSSRDSESAGGAADERGATDRQIDLDAIEELQVVDSKGRVNASLDPGLPDDELLRIHRAMVLTRKLDVRMLAMQRQGEMGTFAPSLGQEATQIGQIYPLTTSDWYSPSYRSFGAQLWRGWTIEGLMLLWDGFFEGFAIPEGVNDLPFSIVVGSHVPVATGVAMGIRTRGDEAAMLVNFGDGALSQGPVCEGLNFAAVYKAPIVFVCENNGYAISIPVEKQSATRVLAARGAGFGIPSMRVDGNDVLSMIVATQRATERARRGDGPTFIEAVTYRMQVHTTADDPKVYRDDEEVEQWKSRDPITRFEAYLQSKGVLDEAAAAAVAESCEQEVFAGRERFRELAKANPREVFDFMFAQMPPELQAQRDEYLAKLDRKKVD